MIVTYDKINTLKPEECDTVFISPIPDNAPELPTQRWFPQRDENGEDVFINGKKQWLSYPYTHCWAYYTTEGRISHHVIRYFNVALESKETPPLHLTYDFDEKKMKWKYGALPEPRILFNLHLIKKYPTAQLLIVEGEKSADAATKLFTAAGRIEQVVPVTWQGGAASIYKADWSPCLNRLCLLWPDNDLKTDDNNILLPKEEQAGYKAMLNIAGILCENTDKKKIKLIDPDQSKPHTWDIADAILDDHWTANDVFRFIRERLQPLPEELPVPPEKKSYPVEKIQLPATKQDESTEPLEHFFIWNEKGPVGFHLAHIAERIVKDEKIIYVGGIYYKYNSEFYEKLEAEDLHKIIYSKTNGMIEKIVTYYQKYKAELFKRNVRSYQKDIESVHIKSISKKTNCFDFDKDHPRIHCQNGMLFLKNNEKWILEPHSSEYFSRNIIPYTYDCNAKCDRFINELIVPNLDDDDKALLQKVFGLFLLMFNIVQKIVLFIGIAGSGKSTIASIIKQLVGPANCTELRTKFLDERFEIARYVGKQLLLAPDVQADFLSTSGASSLKKLTGNDSVTVERKGSDSVSEIDGNKNVLITCNSKLLVNLEGDELAWERRLLIFNFDAPPKHKKIPEFDKLLLKEEGSGILNWALQGAIMLLDDIKRYGDIQLNSWQKDRVTNLLFESDSVQMFCKEMVVSCENSDRTVFELLGAYIDYCNKKGWTALSDRKFENQITGVMTRLFRRDRANDIARERDGKTTDHRGFRGIRIKAAENPVEDSKW